MEPIREEQKFICKNPSCNFNYDRLKFTLDYDHVTLQDDQIRLFCPACGRPIERDLKLYQILPRKGKLYRWHTTMTSAQEEISLGNAIKLKVPTGQLVTISSQEICYPAVPVFNNGKGKLAIPTLPVRKEFLAFVDTTQKAEAEIIQDRYHIQLSLKGLDETIPINLPLVPVQSDRPAQAENAVFDGVHLVLWPHVPYKEWNRYFLRFGSSKEQAEKLINQYRDVKLYSYAKEKLDSEELDSNESDWIEVDAIASDRVTRYGCVESRPEWVAMEFESKQSGKSIGGGVFAIERAEENYPPGYMPIVAFDYGTSNTFIAWQDINVKDGDRERPLPIHSCEKFIISGDDLPSAVDFADTWPPREGVGRSKALLPSEILTRENLKELRMRPEDIERWKPVVNYGIPSGGLKVGYDEAEHIIAEFKWQGMIQDEAFRPKYQDLQKRYLEFLLLFGMAQLANKGLMGKTADVRFSYPLAFSQEDIGNFTKVLESVCRTVTKQTGISFIKREAKVSMEEGKAHSPLLPSDEARAAASSVGKLSSAFSALLYVDIGGGSTDIALEVVGDESEKRHGYTSIASFQYAGSGLASAFAEGNCLKPDVDLNQFRRCIREVGQVRELMKMGTVFHPNKTNPINSKTHYFYSYLVEFLSRLLAAHIINGEWDEGLNVKEIELVKREGYLVALYALGNGWGFGDLIDQKYARDVFSRSLSDRANGILREAMEQEGVPEGLPRVMVQGEELRLADPKGAVAIGLLKGSSEQVSNGDEWAFRTIVGWTTQVGRTRKVPWYRPITNRAATKPEKEEALPPNPNLDCREDEWPLFPPRLPAPHSLDRDLNKTRRFLLDPDMGCVQGRQLWFTQSPFHVLLERLFKPKLKELI